MRSWYHFISPIIILGSLTMILLGFMDVSAFNIKVLDRKVTSQHFNFKGGNYEWDEVRRNLNWEDGLISFNTDYDHLLQSDLKHISSKFESINDIDLMHQIFTTAHYKVKLCVEDFQIDVKDTTLLKKMSTAKMTGYLELYDLEQCDLLYSQYQSDMRFIIQDKMMLFGLGSINFIQNKAKELLVTEVCENIPNIINRFEGPYIWRSKRKNILTFLSLYYGPWEDKNSNIRQASFMDNNRSK
jgi:hypothetical protein